MSAFAPLLGAKQTLARELHRSDFMSTRPN